MLTYVILNANRLVGTFDQIKIIIITKENNLNII